MSTLHKMVLVSMSLAFMLAQQSAQAGFLSKAWDTVAGGIFGSK